MCAAEPWPPLRSCCPGSALRVARCTWHEACPRRALWGTLCAVCAVCDTRCVLCCVSRYSLYLVKAMDRVTPYTTDKQRMNEFSMVGGGGGVGGKAEGMASCKLRRLSELSEISEIMNHAM